MACYAKTANPLGTLKGKFNATKSGGSGIGHGAIVGKYKGGSGSDNDAMGEGEYKPVSELQCEES